MNVSRINRAKTLAERKKRFRIALAHAGLSQADWARQNKVTPAHLSLVLSGDRTSGALDEKIAAFSDKMLRNVA